MNETLLAAGMLFGGALLGYSIRAALFIIKKNSLELSVSERLMHAREQAQQIINEATEKASGMLSDARKEQKEREQFIKQTEDRLLKKETLLDTRQDELTKQVLELDKKHTVLNEEQKKLGQLIHARTKALEDLAGYTQEDARRLLLSETEKIYEEDFQARSHKLETQLHDALEDRAKNILVTAIQRLAVPMANELTTAAVALPNDESKGKIIGKEGRNIRAFERFSGVELLVDESPGYIIVSSFDPIRRAIAVKALESLIKDGRIQPAKIEEEIESARVAIHDIIKEKGGAAVYECGIYNFDPRLIAILGRLHFRTSYGQNVLQHSIEMAHLAEMIAAEIGADTYIAKAGALVHDLGKALDHEFEGTHVEIGMKILKRFNTDERIITAMKSHHDDTPHESIEAVIVQTADMISGSRPGARRDNAEMYLKRLQELERLAAAFNGVEKAYALQAGREIRIFVHPENVSDFEAKNLARTIALNIETELHYPGQIKVTIIRETRIIDYAR